MAESNPIGNNINGSSHLPPTSSLYLKERQKKELFQESISKLNQDTLATEFGFGQEAEVDSHDQCSKMPKVLKEPEVSLTYTWNQTISDVTVTIGFSGLCEEQSKAFDISFTSSQVFISIAGDKQHTLNLFGAIQKEKSRVQLKKSKVILVVVKELPGLWPVLESSHIGNGDVGDKDGADFVNNKEKMESCMDKSGVEGTENFDKPEEPVHHLDLLKHDFFERDLVFTVQVYIKCLDKDAVKVLFSKDGFVLKFHTGDVKFLNLHEGTSVETTFSWAVKTKQEIMPEQCKFRVKVTGVEISLRKLSSERWTSLEAPLRKESSTTTSSNWMPIQGQGEAAQSSKVPPAAVAFDEMGDIDLNRAKRALAESRSSTITSNQDTASFSYGENIKIKSGSQDLNKPTAKVHPLNTQMDPPTQVIPAGFAGLVNFGNTCFMNCVLQVLANTAQFRDYFLDDRFQSEINEDNPLGMKGQLAMTFGVLMKRLWSRTRHCWEPRKLKDLISKKNPQFFGYAQHDAHEFLAFLLDGLHEDLNRIRKKPYTETIDSNGRPDEVVANEAWAQYKQRNDSVVVDLFQGQYKSKLVCPKCGKVSITFDPFLYLSVPLPKKKKVIFVTFMWRESYRKPIRYQIVVCQDSTVEKLKEELAQRTHVKAEQIRVFEAHRGRIHKFFTSGASLANVEPKDIIIASEVLSEEVAGEEVVEIPVMQRTLHPSEYPSRCAYCHTLCPEGSPLKRCTKCYKVGYCDQTCQRSHWNLHKSQCSTCPEPIGCPFILSVPVSRATYSQLVKHMEGMARFSVDIFQPPVKEPTQPTLNNSLSQSCSSLNSLDSLSSASSTCTLTGDHSDTVIEATEEPVDPAASAMDSDSGISSSSSLRSVGQTAGPQDCPVKEKLSDTTLDKSTEKGVPTSHVMGVQASETERERAPPTFFIKPVNMEGVGIKGSERLEDKGDTPLEVVTGQILSMDWRNNDKLHSYVLVQSKELEAEEVDNLNTGAAASGNKPTLHQCLELFTEPEVLSPEEAWYCPSCKKHVEASKQMSIWRLPHILIIQLKRFSFQHFLMRSKIKKMVDFPTRELNLSEFCVGLQPDDPPPVYDLYGVANHHGLLIGGHYTSYVKCVGPDGRPEVDWRLCDDSRVSGNISERSVVTADAYLLFYIRRGPPAVINSANPPNAVPTSLIPTVVPTMIHEMAPRAVPDVASTTVPLDSAFDRSQPEIDDNKNYISPSEEKKDREKEIEEEREKDIEEVREKDVDVNRGEEVEEDMNESGSEEEEEEENKLVIDIEQDLGYTDMEAVD